ncbi:hypothetical protein LCGC14_2415980, partial [marine sediment metagenome]
FPTTSDPWAAPAWARSRAVSMVESATWKWTTLRPVRSKRPGRKTSSGFSSRYPRDVASMRSEELFRLALKDSNITVFNQDMDLRYTWVYNPNPGLSVDEVIGKTDEELVPSDDAAVLTDMKQRALEQGKEQQKTIRFTVGDEPLYYDLKVEPMFDNDGRVIGVIGVSTDISDYTLDIPKRRLSSSPEIMPSASARQERIFCLTVFSLTIYSIKVNENRLIGQGIMEGYSIIYLTCTDIFRLTYSS